jgi:hypothetical protein
MKQRRNVAWILSEDEKREIERLYRAGVPARLIAPRYGVTSSAIWNLAFRRKIRRTWWTVLERWNREHKW